MVMFSTAALLDEATTISKPVSASRGPRSLAVVPSGRSITARFTKASFGDFSVASSAARLTTIAAIRSRSSVVLPVPGGPLTANIAVLLSRMIVFTANCWLMTSARSRSAGQRPDAKPSGLVPSVSRCRLPCSRRSTLLTSGSGPDR